MLDGRLLAGPYPGASKKAEAAAMLETFLDAGVTCFVDLTEGWSAHDTLVLDQQAIDRMGITVVPADPSPVPTLGEIVATLGNGAPVVIEGSEPGWCVQAVAQDDGLSVQVEVLDPEHWESGPALPPEQQRTIEQLGFYARDERVGPSRAR